MAMAETLKIKLLASFMRAWDAASGTLNALAKCNCFAASLPREGMCLAQKTLSHAPELPEDLIVEILSRLPVKALMRFRCVSKAWNSLIFHPTFVNWCLQRSSKDTHILIQFNEEENGVSTIRGGIAPCSIRRLLENPSSTIDDCCYRLDRNYFVLGSCNGLVCLYGFFIGDEFEEHYVRFWNPATRIMSKDSPCLQLSLSNYDIGPFGFGFGFGFDDGSDTYKVVILSWNIGSQNWEVRLHSLGDTCWRNVLTCPAFSTLETNDGKLASGALNWLALRNPLNDHFQSEPVTIDQLVIFSYDLKNETYRYLLMPDGFEFPYDDPCLRVLKGCLCLSHDRKRTHFVVWLVREFGVQKSWTQLLNVSYEHLSIYILSPLCISEDEDVLLLKNFLHSKFVLYNKRDNRIERIEDCNGKFGLFSYDYVESLVLPY